MRIATPVCALARNDILDYTGKKEPGVPKGWKDYHMGEGSHCLWGHPHKFQFASGQFSHIPMYVQCKQNACRVVPAGVLYRLIQPQQDSTSAEDTPSIWLSCSRKSLSRSFLFSRTRKMAVAFESSLFVERVISMLSTLMLLWRI